jgi:serine protease Do
MSTKKTVSVGFLAVSLLLSTVAGGAAGFIANNFTTAEGSKEQAALSSTESKQESPEDEEITAQRIVVEEESSVIEAVEKVAPAVVSVVVTKEFEDFRSRSFMFDQFFNDPFFDAPPQGRFREEPDTEERSEPERMQVGGGSGFIFDSQGLVLTNRHVVDDQEAEYSVVLNDGREYSAEVLDRDSYNDIAVLKIVEDEEIDAAFPDAFPVLQVGDSDLLKVGQKVIAVGNALAEFENTVTTGVISAKGREITASDFSRRSAEMLSGLLQTDAAINPGNSGGPLVNLQGQVIGLNTAIASNANGIGFAIPINDAKLVMNSVKENGRIVRPYLGVRYLILNEDRAEAMDLEITQGAMLVGNDLEGSPAVVPGSPAEKADLRSRDVIISVDGQDITEENDLRSAIATKQIGEETTLTIWRRGEELEIEVTLEEQP